MKKWSIKNAPTKENILAKFQEIDIFNWYLNTNLTEDSYFCNPMRNDHKPDCRFYRGQDGRLRMIDPAGYFHGDFIDLVQYLNHCSYHQAIKIIWRDLGGGTRTVSVDKQFFEHKQKQRIRKKILVKKKEWDLYTLAYWQRYHISQQVLEKFNVFPLEVVWMGQHPYKQNEYHRWEDHDPIYGYALGDGEWKIYRPLAPKGKLRFIGNTNILQGQSQLEDSSYLVITKSMKDVMVLNLFNVPAVAPHSEGIVLSELGQMLYYYEIVFIFFDNDMPGKRATVKYMYEGCVPLLLKETKDISDYIEQFGFERTNELVNEVKERFWLGD